MWSETIALINGDGAPWYANSVTGGTLVINPNNQTTGKFGNGFDISVAPVVLDQAIVVPVGVDSTIEMWVYYRGDAVGSPYTCLTSSQILNITPDRRLWAYSGNSLQSEPGVIKLNDWTHLAMTVTTLGIISIYADGNRVGTVPTAATLTHRKLVQ